MAAILREDPPELEGQSKPIPLALRRIIDHCLQFVQAELGMRRIELVPTRRVHLAVEAGQHDGALRQPRDGDQQVARRRLRTGRSGGDHRRRGRGRLPACRLGADRLGAPLDGIDLPALRQHRRPRRADDVEEGERAPPMLGEIAGHEAGQFVEADALDRQLIEKSAQFAGEF